jgi:hypothetical protein
MWLTDRFAIYIELETYARSAPGIARSPTQPGRD